MSTLAFKDFKYDTRLSPAEILLLDEIVGLSKKNGYCWASNETLGSKFNRKVKTIQEYVQKLKKLGYISVAVIRDHKSKEVLKREIHINGDKPKFEYHTVTIYKDGEKVVRIVPLKTNGNKTKRKTKAEKQAEAAIESTNVVEEVIEPTETIEDSKEEIKSDSVIIKDEVTGLEYKAPNMIVELKYKEKFGLKGIKKLADLQAKYGIDRILCVLDRCTKPESVDYPIAYIKKSIKQNESEVFPEWLADQRIKEMEEARREEVLEKLQASAPAYEAYQQELNELLNNTFKPEAVAETTEEVSAKVVSEVLEVVEEVKKCDDQQIKCAAKDKIVFVNNAIYKINDVDSSYIYVIKNGVEDFIELDSEEALSIKNTLKYMHNIEL